MADAPKVGQIVEHHFLWLAEHSTGQFEGRKRRPCLIVAVEERGASLPRVTLLPITSQIPRGGTSALAIPRELNARIGLDPGRDAWVVLDEANVFAWPGFDLVPQRSGGYVRGSVTAGFFTHVRNALIAMRTRGRPKLIERDDG
jgi:hypothetical protein